MGSSLLFLGASALFGFLIYLVVKFLLWYREFSEIAKYIDKVPGLPKHWLYGTQHWSPGFNEKFISWKIEQVQQFPRICRIWNGPLNGCVLPHHPETASQLLKSAEPKPLKMGSPYALLRPWLGDGLLISTGAKWNRNRKLITPAFHFEILKPYVEIYNSAVEKLLCKWEDQCAAAAAGGQQGVEIYKSVELCTFEVILKCAFSLKEDIQGQGENHPYVSAALNLSRMIIERVVRPWQYWDFVYYLTDRGRQFKRLCNYTHQFAEGVISKRKQALAADPDQAKTRYPDFLDILLLARDTDGQGLSDQEIRQEVDTFLFAGHDTTASGLSWTLYSLAQHPHIQDKVRQEVEELLDGRQDNTIEWADLSKLPYMTMCIKESLRLYSVVPIIGRTLTKKTVIDGYTLLPGTEVGVFTCSIHHNPLVWGQDHMEFKPERFKFELTKKMDPYAFVPFSAGPRNCIGKNFAMNELKVMLARILHRFQLSVDPERPALPIPAVVMRPQDGIWLKLKARN